MEKSFHLWKFWKLVWHPLEILKSKTKTHGNSTRFFLEHPWKFHCFLMNPGIFICYFINTTENSKWNFHQPWFLDGIWISKGCSYILWNFQEWSFFFCRISKSKVTKLKILGTFSKKCFLNLLCLDFFWNSPLFDYFGFDWDLQTLTFIYLASWTKWKWNES